MALQSLFIRGWKQLIANVLIIQQNKHMKYDYLIVGSGLYGAMFAYKAKQAGRNRVIVNELNLTTAST